MAKPPALMPMFQKIKTAAPGKPFRTKLGQIVVHIGSKFSMVCFPQVKWHRKRIPAEWRN